MSAAMVATSTRPVHLKPIFGKSEGLLTVALEGVALLEDEQTAGLARAAASIEGVKHVTTAGELLIVAYEGHSKRAIIGALKKTFRHTCISIDGGRKGRAERRRK